MRDVFPKSVQDFIAWLKNFLTVAATMLVDLGWDAIFLDALNTRLAELEAKYAASVAAKAVAKSAVEEKDFVLRELMKEMRPLISGIQINDKITDTKKENLGVKVRDIIPSHEVPFIPSVLIVKGLSEGANKLDWDDNGNKRGTQYIIECRYGTEGNFQSVDTVLATKYQHDGQTPGVAVYYRITARRGKLKSLPCDPVGIYT